MADIHAWICTGVPTLLPFGLLIAAAVASSLVVLLICEESQRWLWFSRFYAWLFTTTLVTWAASDILFRVWDGTRIPIVGSFEFLLIVAYLPLGTMLLLLWFVAGDCLIIFSYYLRPPATSKPLVSQIVVTVLAGVSNAYFAWWMASSPRIDSFI